jgi:hypothetical protein
MFQHWMQSLAKQLGVTRLRQDRKSTGTARRPLPIRPDLESLEERVVPVTEIFTVDPNQAIDPNNGLIYNFNISTSKITALIDVDVFIRIDHTWQGDLSVFLTDGTKNSVLIDRVGATGTTDDGYSNANFGTGTPPNVTYLTLDDQAATNIHFYGGANGVTGSFQPDNNTTAGFYTGAAGNQPLSNFNGLSGNRTWTLKILDHFPASDNGTLISWGLRFTGNDPPSNVVVNSATTNENQAVTVSGKFDDPNTTQTHKVVLNWGDGTPDTTLNLAAGVLTFSAPHTYVDDDPTGTASDKFTVTATVTDSVNESATGKGTVTVNNVDPSAIVITPDKASYVEGDVITLSGSFTDPGVNDTFTVKINWGDGSPVDTFTLAKGVTTFAGKTHTFADDNPTGTASDNSTITVTVTDDDTGTVTNTKTVTVGNVTPSTPTLNQTSFTINEGGTFTLAGSFTDPGTLDVHSIEIDWDGNGTFEDKRSIAVGSRTFSFVSPVYPDDAALTVKVRVLDDDTGTSAAASATLKVNNVPPSNIVVTAGNVDEGSPAAISGKFDDPGSLDTHSVEIDWNNDGTFDQTVNLAAGVTTFSVTGPAFVDDDPSGSPFDPATIKIRVTDKDGGQATTTAQLTVKNVAPSKLAIGLDKTVIDEDQVVTLGGSFFDPGVNDSFVVTINWGDGKSDTFNLAAGTQAFAGKSHKYLDDDADDTYTISVSVTDDDTGTVATTTNVTVKNVAPSKLALNLDKTTLNENEVVTLGGTFADPGSQDTFTVTINWGDGSANTTLNLGAGTTNFSTTHQYLNDDLVGGTGNGTASDNFTITVTVTDDDAGSTNTNTTVTVNNVAPGNLVLSNPFTINEDDSILLTGSFTDPGSKDKHTVEIDWNGDGVYDETLTLAAGVLTFSAKHQYLDDVPSNSPSDKNAINVRVRDLDLGEITGATAVTVNNVNPSVVSLTQYPLPINENDTITLTGTFTDAGSLDTHTVQIDWDGDNKFDQTLKLNPGARSFSVTHQYLDDNPTKTVSDTNKINVVVTDDDTGTGASATTITIKNLAPTVNVTGPSNAVIGVPLKYIVDFSDIGTLDTHEISVDWGDGTVDPFKAATSPQTLFHSFQNQGINTITFSIRDDDGSVTSVDRTVKIGPVGPGVDVCDPNDFSHISLYASGTNGNDIITFVPAANGAVSVIINGKVYGPFHPNAHVIAFGLGGNDRISVHPGLGMSAIFYGGNGNDVLTGSKGNDQLFGDNGNDTLIGGHGRDVLVGGFGSDVLYGHYTVQKPSSPDDQDLLIGNATLYDRDAVNACSVLQEWTNPDRTFDERRERLRLGIDGTPTLDLTTVLEDGARDKLFSVRSTDWLFQDAAGLDRVFGPIPGKLS